MVIDKEDIYKYKKDGFLIKKGFYSKDILRDLIFEIRKVLCLFLDRNNIEHRKIKRNEVTFDNFDEGLIELSQKCRQEVGLVYDLVKQLPGFVNLSSSSNNRNLYSRLINSDLVCWAASGNGVRIDIPQERKFLYPWHQDFPYQMRSMDGAVFWAPLKSITETLGALEVAIGSHHNGIYKLFYTDTGEKIPQGYKLRVRDVDTIIKNFNCTKVYVEPTDLLIFDFKLLHKSGFNKSKDARWSMQFRYFNIYDEYAINNNWQGGYESGMPIHDHMPELFTESVC